MLTFGTELKDDVIGLIERGEGPKNNKVNGIHWLYWLTLAVGLYLCGCRVNSGSIVATGRIWLVVKEIVG
jgi:hypothetical protein